MTLTVFHQIMKSSISPCKDALLCLHGIESHSSWFHDFCGHLQKQTAVDVFLYDRHGWGRSAGKRGHAESSARLIGEIEEVLSLVDGRRLHLLGMSWGGLLAIAAAARPEIAERLSSLILLAPGIAPFWRPSMMQLAKLATLAVLRPEQATLALPFAPQDFCVDPAKQAAIVADELKVTHVSAQTILTTLDLRRTVKGALAAKSMPWHVFLAGNDTIIDNGPVKELAERYSGEVTIYPQARHALVLEIPERLALDVADWLESAAQARNLE